MNDEGTRRPGGGSSRQAGVTTAATRTPAGVRAAQRWLLALVVLGALVCALLDLVARAVAGIPAATAVRAVAWVLLWLATSGPVVARARRSGHDQQLWRPIAVFVVGVGATVAARPLLELAAPRTMLPLLPVAVTVLVIGPVAFSALIGRQLDRVHAAAIGDHFNAVGSVLTGQALLGLLVDRTSWLFVGCWPRCGMPRSVCPRG